MNIAVKIQKRAIIRKNNIIGKFFKLVLTFKFPYGVRLHGMVSRVPAFQPGGPGSIAGGVRNFHFYPWTVSFVICPVLSLAMVLILCLPDIQGGPPLCICLVFWYTVCGSPYKHLAHGHLDCKSWECKSYNGGE